MSSITILTTLGRAQLAAAVANEQPFPSAKIVVGDGNGATYVPNENQTALVHQVWVGNATVARTDDRVIFQAVIPAAIGGFIVREVGVLVGAVGAEQLFIVSQHPSTEKIAAPANGSGPLPITIAFSASASEQAVLPIGASDNATLQLSRAPHITVDGLVTAPPVSPADGAMLAIDAGATGVFVGKGGWLVERVAGAWIYKQPPEKSVIRLASDGAWYQRSGADWIALPFDDPSILWAQVLDPPATFEPLDNATFQVAETAPINDPPEVPAGQRRTYLIGAAPTGAWGGATPSRHGQVAISNGSGGWNFQSCRPGRVFRVGNTDTYYRWSGVGWEMHAFPSSAHNHDDRYFTEAEADGRFVKLAGDTLTGNVALPGDGAVSFGGTHNAWGPVTVYASGGAMLLRTGSAERVRVSSTGNVGIGTAAPARTLDVAGWARVQGNLEPLAGIQLTGTLGTTAHVLTGGSAASWRTLAEMGIATLQTLWTENNWYGDINGAITANPASPTTEGVSIMTLNVTPKRADSRLRIRFTMMVGHAGGAYPAVRVIHSGANVLTTCHTIEYSPWLGILTGEIEVASGSVATRTIDIRLGNLGGGGTIKLNGSSTTALTGSRAVLTVTEVM